LSSTEYVRNDRIAEVKEMVDAYADMAAYLSEGNVIIQMAMASWLQATMNRMVHWGALTEEESHILVEQVREQTEQQEEQIRLLEKQRAEEAPTTDPGQNDDNAVLVMIRQQGI